MGGGDFGGFADIGLGDIAFDAIDLGSVVTDFGTEFMSSFDITSFDVGLGDIAGLGGFDIAGSLAGNADWFNTFNIGSVLDGIPSIGDFDIASIGGFDSFNIGSILSSVPSIGDFNLPSLPSAFPALSQLNTASLVSAGASALGISPAITAPVTQLLNGASPISAGAAALGINPTVVASATQVLNGASPIGAATSALGISPQTTGLITNIVSDTPGVNPITSGLNILSASETAQLTRNINPGLINNLVDPAANVGAAIANQLPNAALNTSTNITNPGQYSIFKNEDGTYGVLDNGTGDTVSTGLTEQQALLAEQDLNIVSPGIDTSSNAVVTGEEDPYEVARLAIEAQSRENSPTEADVVSASNGITVGQVNNARYQQSVRELRNNKAQATDWRVRLRLAPNSTYLYNDTNNGVLLPLKGTDGIIFPYTPSIETAYKANYDVYDLTHSNYRGYFYKNSYVDAVNVRATFTAQDTKEADYLLAVIHFFRSCTKMFYGQDAQRGAPPPLVYLSGYGDYQFQEHPCVVSQFNYTLPPDVDYIRCQYNLQSNTNQTINRLRNPIANNPVAYSVNRLLNSNLFQGALGQNPAQTGGLANGQPTYVPTKMEIAITLLPTQSRSNISNNFSVQGFANGNLLKDGFW